MDFLKSLGSSVSPYYTLGVAILVGLALAPWRRTRRLGKLWIASVLTAYVVFSLPAVASAVADRLPALTAAPPGRPVRTLVVFDGDNRRGRLREALKVMRSQDQATVWVLGDVEGWFLDEFEALGFRRAGIGHDVSTADTREQVAWVGRLATDHPGTSLAVVASRLQAPRIAALARASGLDIPLIASPIDDEPPASGWRRWAPTYIALRTSRDALYEHAALWYYGRKGWID